MKGMRRSLTCGPSLMAGWPHTHKLGTAFAKSVSHQYIPHIHYPMLPHIVACLGSPILILNGCIVHAQVGLGHVQEDCGIHNLGRPLPQGHQDIVAWQRHSNRVRTSPLRSPCLAMEGHFNSSISCIPPVPRSNRFYHRALPEASCTPL